jgi:hypothetical protein
MNAAWVINVLRSRSAGVLQVFELDRQVTPNPEAYCMTRSAAMVQLIRQKSVFRVPVTLVVQQASLVSVGAGSVALTYVESTGVILA